MKRYLLFIGDVYYSNGGWDDYIGSYDNLEEAIQNSPKVKKSKYLFTRKWWHVVDIYSKRIVKEGRNYEPKDFR